MNHPIAGNLKQRAYTLVEISIGLAVLFLVGTVGYSTLINSTTLLAKNVSLNSSNITVRGVLDRIYAEVNQANGLPKLINADGSAATDSGPAAGIIFDRYLGGPYVVGNPGPGLSATATSLKLYCSTDPLASPPVPVKNDVIRMDASSRPLVSSCTSSTSFSSPIPSPAPSPGQMLTVTLQSQLGNYTVPTISSGTAIPWSSSVQQTAYLVHRKAFVVVPVNGRGELRMYNDAEGLTNYNDLTKYVVLTRAIGTQIIAGQDESKPFSLVTQNATKFLSIAMRVEDQQFNKYLAAHQSKEFNTFLRIDTSLRPRSFL